MFEIKLKDNLGRTGILKTKHGVIKTPALMPVIHPGKQSIDVKSLGAEIVITNAYIIYKNEELREKASKKGVHELINFDGPVMTDSGSFQLSEYGDIDIGNKEVIEFQELIGSDIGTSLDIPTPPYVSHGRAERDLEITLKRAKESLKYKKNIMLNSVVQGSTFTDLRARCAEELGKMDFELHPIGAVVPLMENYQYKDLVDVVISSVSHLPESRPRHLMGAGHPMIFALAVAMGCDLFDSAAYILYAEDDRFLSVRGTYKLENLVEMPCSCPICIKYTPDDLRKMEKSERKILIAQHNLYVSFAEIRSIKQAIAEGSLMELVETRCRSHPRLLEAYRQLGNYAEIIEKYHPASKKSAFFYSGPESLNRVEVYRHMQKIQKMPKKSRLLLLSSTRKPYHKYLSSEMGDFFSEGSSKKSGMDDTDIMVADVPFGLIPLELDEVYPLAQNEAPGIIDKDAKEFVKSIIENTYNEYEEVIVHADLDKKYQLGLFSEYILPDNFKIKIDELKKIKSVANYQFGPGAGEGLFEGDVQIVKSKKTGKIRHIYIKDNLIATMRASDGLFVLSKEGAIRLHEKMEYPINRVVVNADSEPFAREGKSIFAKFIIDCDKNIKANDEVLIVNDKDELLAFGKSLLSSYEINDFKTGQAIKTRKGGI
ncbi:tRNA guanosine(15) transglycosylase TgtA [Methanobacterium alcaliphilum]|uniref:tRNA guanosine(15) transglycosylase TgtA n=1 Tax=Methanobacterium alcaliphilum TaxID=392018 RepID=UPI00200BA13B|nr:tRNA guanosine(15) transglycosylase TgtA [Methanobacterium alcaliphilum]MCK9151630.1 tRNA guanosine(15) transglycosylase TgtA [Methanobacterium alcaliphilum]